MRGMDKGKRQLAARRHIVNPPQRQRRSSKDEPSGGDKFTAARSRKR